MHLSFKSVCNKEHKGVKCYMISSSNSSKSTRPIGRVLWENYSSFLDFTRNYERASGIFVPWNTIVFTNAEWNLPLKLGSPIITGSNFQTALFYNIKLMLMKLPQTAHTLINVRLLIFGNSTYIDECQAFMFANSTYIDECQAFLQTVNTLTMSGFFF